MDKAKRYLLQAKEYLSHFKKVEKKGGPPKLKVTNKKTVNIAVIGGIAFLLLLVSWDLFVLSHFQIK